MTIRSTVRALSALMTMGAAQMASAQLVISQVYTTGGQAGALYRNDYVEIYNRSNVAVPLVGYSIQYASASGTFGFLQLTANLNGTVPAHGYYLIQFASTTNPGAGAQLPTPDAVANVQLLGAAGKIALVGPPATLLPTIACPLAGFGVVDFVHYGPLGSQPCFEGSGPFATSLNSPTLAMYRKDGGCRDTNDNALDFETGVPNPRNSAVTRAACPSTGADLAPLARQSPAAAIVGTDTITFSIDVQNLGQASAASSSLTLAVPTGVALVSSSPPGTLAGGVITVPLGSIAPFQISGVTIVVNPLVEQAWTASIDATTTSGDSTPANNSVSLPVYSLDPPALSPLKINQIYPGGSNSISGATYNQDYVEIHNAGTRPAILNGRSLQFRTSQSGSWFKLNLPDTTIPPGGFFLVGQADPGTTGAPLPVTLDAQTSNVVTLDETQGAVALVNNQVFLGNGCVIPTPTAIDLVGWGSPTFLCAENFSPVAWIPGDVIQAMYRVDLGCTDTGDNFSDFIVAAPMPRNSQSLQVICASSCNPADICGVGATYDNGTVDVGPDKQLTIEDFLNFLAAFGDTTGCPGAGPCNPADICGVGATYELGTIDIGPDGDLTIEDFLNFLAAFGDSTGCS